MEEGYANDLEVEEKRRNDEEWEKCGWERGKQDGGSYRGKGKKKRSEGGGGMRRKVEKARE